MSRGRVSPDENPLNHVKNFVRKELNSLGELTKIIKASVEFATAAFYIDREQGDPNRNVLIAEKAAGKLGLSQEEINRARSLGNELFTQYSTPPNSQDNSTEQVGKQEISPPTRKRRPKKPVDIISINTTSIGNDIGSVLYILKKRVADKSFRTRFNGSWMAVVPIKTLLEGGEVARSSLEAAGVNPREIVKFCRTTIVDFTIKEAAGIRNHNGSLRKELRPNPRRSQDPQKYLRDRSHRSEYEA